MLVLAFIILGIGFFGLWYQRTSLIHWLLCLELMLLAVIMVFIHFGGLHGQVFSLFIIAASAAEVALGLALFVLYFRQYKSIAVEAAHQLKG